MRSYAILLLLPCVLACGQPNPDGNSEDPAGEGYALPVRVERPSRGTVADTIETQATLAAELEADVYAEIEGKVLKRVRDLGDRVGEARNGDDPFLLALIDDRDLALALQDAEAKLSEQQGRIEELKLEQKRAQRELEQAKVALDEAKAVLKRTEIGIRDGTISMEENERARFAETLARSKVDTAQATLEKAEVARAVAVIAVEPAKVAVARAKLALERATVRAPFAGVVSSCNVREGERVTQGMLLYTIVDPTALRLFADVPVRQAARVREGNAVLIGSNAVARTTTGQVVLVSPTVNEESGTVKVKVRVQPAPGFKPGLFVTLRIVVETREDALVVPKRAVLHDDEEGAYLFVVEAGKARRVLVETGYEQEERVEIAGGLAEDAQVVVEGQDTVSGGALVEIKE